ncbi:hypothetical protein CRM22_005256 [Opisthorchis felineus]|uniref:RNA helicase n=1 Tax=Opisthorchis felineus TaxID=147828 RepID=A0A4S2LS32_OPIFE|nr:hypothetical protein CRM22_005256 [Opisthorchis felineus]
MPSKQSLGFINPEDDSILKGISEEVPEAYEDGGVGSSLVPYRIDGNINSIEQQRQHLPVFSWRSSILYLLETNRVLIITGETGSGKSTQLPQYVYEAGWLIAKPTQISPNGATMAVTQPRRVAALTLAARVAEEKNWQLGQHVGYSIRFEECRTPQVTVISYMTEGMLVQELLRDPLLRRFRVVMLDEVHERSLQTDILLGLMKKVLRKRPYDLRLIVSSATVEVKRFMDYFSDLCKPDLDKRPDSRSLGSVAHLNVEGRQYPVHVFYSIDPVPCYLKASKDVVFNIHESRPLGGDILVFVTGQNEVIQLVGELVDEYRARKERFLQSKATEKPSKQPVSYPPLRCLPLHGSLPQSDQLRIFDRPTRSCRKVVVATNIAETSVTLPGISYVVDCGFARLKAYNPTTGLEALVTVPTSQASARQRAGRAGRTRTGETFRLYTEEVYHSLLPRFTPPESLRTDLSGALLRLKTLGVDRLARFDWLDPPPPSHVGQAAERLVALGALDPDTGRLTVPRGLKLAEVSTACGLDQPSAAAALLGSCEEGCSQEIAAIVSLMQIQRLFVSAQGQRRHGDRLRRQLFGCRQGDHLTELNAFTAYEKQAQTCSPSELRNWCRDAGLNFRGLVHAVTLRDRIGVMFRRLKLPWVKAEPEGNPEPVLRALVRGYFHQVARLAPSGSHYLTVRGDHQLRLHPNCVLYSSCAKWPAWILFTNVFLATDAAAGTEDSSWRISSSGDGLPTCVSGVSAIQPDWLLELAPHYYHFGTDREHLERALRVSA